MKNVLMIIFLLGGFVLSNVNAQSGCIPCPPGCCLTSCPVKGSASASAATVQPTGVAVFASYSPEAMSGTCDGKQMSKKDMKACQAACQINFLSATDDNAHVAPASIETNATPKCQVPCQPTKCGNATSAVAAQPAIPVTPTSNKG